MSEGKRTYINSKPTNIQYEVEDTLNKMRELSSKQLRDLQLELEKIKEPLNVEICKLKNENDLLIRELDRTQQINRDIISEFISSMAKVKQQSNGIIRYSIQRSFKRYQRKHYQ